MLVRSGVALAPFTTLRLGGPAARLVTACSEQEVVEACAVDGPLLVLGGGSNLVVADAGVEGTVVRVCAHGVELVPAGDRVLLTASAGEPWDALVELTVAEGLAGLEALSGIPGLVGATPVQNVGAYGADIAQTVARVRALDRRDRAVRWLTAADCGFGYRSSALKAEPDRWVVLAVTFSLVVSGQSAPVGYAELARALGVDVGAAAPAAEVRAAVLALRRGKGMVVCDDDPDSRSAGSFFTNPVLSGAALAALAARVDAPVPGHPDGPGRTKVSAAWLIEQAGFRRGDLAGPVGLSGKHVLALVHRGGGTTADLLRAAREVRDGVRERLGVTLVPEPVLVGGIEL